MNFDDTARELSINIPPETAEACRYLEGLGLRFCVDFGTANAAEKAGGVIIEHNPPAPISDRRKFLAASVSGVQWTHEDRQWLREMEAAFCLRR